MRELFDYLNKLEWLNFLAAHAIAPLVLTGVTCMAVTACAPVRLCAKKVLCHAACYVLLRLLVETLAQHGQQLLSGLAQFVCSYILIFLIWGQPSRKGVWMMLQLIIISFVADTLSYVFIVSIFPHDLISAMWFNTKAAAIFTSCIPTALVWALVTLLWRILRRRRIVLSPVMFYMQVALVAALAVSLPFLPLSTTIGPPLLEQYTSLFKIVGCLIAASILFLVINFVTVHARYRRQLQYSNSLVKQQEMYEALIADQRSYRHNLTNMLYGLEGQLLSGNIAEIRAYHSELITKYQLINNENLVSVQRIPVPSVKSLLLRHIELSQKSGVPFYLVCEKLESWCGMKESDLCAVMGILLDNAREAAQGATAPVIRAEIRNMEDMLEIVIRNSYVEAPDLSAMGQDGFSTKGDGHGVGLSSVRRLLHKYKRTYFCISLQGQYVVQQMLLP